jgi:hypothetical protein
MGASLGRPPARARGLYLETPATHRLEEILAGWPGSRCCGPPTDACPGQPAWEDHLVVPENIHDFFMGSAGVTGALIGLLFVAISVAGPRLARAEATAQVHRIRANASLIAFTNSLSVSLFALIPGEKIGWTSVAVSTVGLVFIAAALLSLLRAPEKHWSIARDAFFLVGMAVAFAVELIAGLNVAYHPGDSGSVETIAILVIVFCLIGIGRAWELVGGPSIGLREQVVGLVREEFGHEAGDEAGNETAREPRTAGAPAGESAGEPERAGEPEPAGEAERAGGPGKAGRADA